MLLIQLFWVFFQIGILSFGGGYACLPLIQDQIVLQLHWISNTEFANLVTVSQMTPGPIAINAATFVGLKVGGLMGAIVATFGCVLPSCIIVSILAILYTKYKKLPWLERILKWLRPAVVGLILIACVQMIVPSFQSSTEPILWGILFLVAMACLLKTKWNPVLIMIGIGVLNVLCHLL